jgi:hypothetical protein
VSAYFIHFQGVEGNYLEKIDGNVLCSSKNGCNFAADFAAHVLLAMMLMR